MAGLPRMRGDRPWSLLVVDGRLEFTPHARGSTSSCCYALSATRVYPACAGIDRAPFLDELIQNGLPRMRGDRPLRL